MRVLVTGGTGYLGAAIVRALHARCHEPVVFARSASRTGLPGLAVDGDVRDDTAVRRALDGVDAVIHAAALVSVWRPRAADFDAVNVGGLRNVLAAARERRIGRLAYTSSFLALPPTGESRPLEANDYQRTKVRALLVARDAARSQPLVILCPGVIYGPGAATEGNLVGRLIRDHLHGRLPGVIGADRRWSYAYIDDVAQAHVTAIERAPPTGEFLLGGENATQMQVFEIVKRETGRALPRRIPLAAARVAAAIEEARAQVLGRPPLLTRGVIEILRRDWTLDSERSVRELNYRVTALALGLRHVLAGLE